MRGVIAGGNRETARAGAEILRAGGNAADAAIAAAFVSFIGELAFVHLGGSGIAQVHRPGEGTLCYDFFSNTPGLGSDRPIEDLDFKEVEIDYGGARQSFHLGRGSVAVPGNVSGLCQLAADFATFPLSRLLAPALRLADEGVVLDRFQSDTCRILAPLYTHTEGMRQIFLRNGRMIEPEERTWIPDLGKTLRQIVSEGSDSIRSGELAQALIKDQLERGGRLTHRDLREYEVRTRPAISIRYRGWDLHFPPPSSIGGVLTALSIRILSNFKLDAVRRGSAEHLRILIEVMAATSRARADWDRLCKGDAESAAAKFLQPERVSRYFDEIRNSLQRGDPGPTTTEPPGPPATSHLSVVDNDGMAVSLTTTAGESAGYVVPGTGFIPNNMMGEADLHPSGFHTQPAGRRIQTMMTPLVALSDGEVGYVLGTGGSTRIRSATIQVLSNLLDFDLPLQQAVDEPRIHLEDGVVQCEGGLLEASLDQLEQSGYRLNRWDRRSIYFGGAHCVQRTSGGTMNGAGDPRRGGTVRAG